MHTTNPIDPNAIGRAIAIALIAGMPADARARLAAKVRARQERTSGSNA